MENRKMTRSSVFVVVASMLMLWCPTRGVRADEISELKKQIQDQAKQLQKMQDRLEQLEARQRLKEKSLNRKIEEVAKAKPQAGPTDFRVFWKEGLNFATQDGDFTLKVGGRLMYDWLWISEDDAIKASTIGEQQDGSEVRRARLYMQGLIYGNVEYKLQFDFADGDEVDLKDAYVGLTDFPLGKLRMGHFKEPFSLEELTSSKYITFLERGLPNVFAPSRNAGLMLHSSEFNDRMTWAVGLFRDTDDTGTDMDDGGYNVTGRLTWLPIYEDKGASLVHVGAAYSYRNPDDALRYRQRPEAHLTSRFVDTGTFTSDQVDLWGLEAAWVGGPFSLQGEYIFADADRLGGGPDVDFDGWYAQASYFLTGEHRRYKTSSGAFSRVKPKSNFSFDGGGPGAWEIAARYSELNLDDEDISGGGLENITAGLNWHLNPNMRIMWNYVHADRDDVGEADILQMRWQIDF
jgi:phosphate-selective porin OprO/OprP